MKPENKQRFSIRKYAIGAASVLIGFAFHAQAVAADGVVPTTTENQPTIQAAGESSPQASKEVHVLADEGFCKVHCFFVFKIHGCF